MKKIWVVLHRDPGEDWQEQGFYETEQQAVDHSFPHQIVGYFHDISPDNRVWKNLFKEPGNEI